MDTPNEAARAAAESHLLLEERIRERAEAIWRARGEQPGSDLEDWLQAEREILGSQGSGTVVGSALKPDKVFSDARVDEWSEA